MGKVFQKGRVEAHMYSRIKRCIFFPQESQAYIALADFAQTSTRRCIQPFGVLIPISIGPGIRCEKGS